MIDPLVLAQVDKSKPLKVRAYRGGETTCVLCGADIFRGEWVVTLPSRLGVAQDHCAYDAGFTLK